MPKQKANVSDVESNLAVEARVVPAGYTQLYAPSDDPVWVPDESVPRFLASGFRFAIVDPHEAAQAFLAAVRALVPAAETVVADVESDSEAYFSNAMVAYQAVQNVANTWAALGPVLFGQPEQAAGVKMKNAAGQPVEVDPGQVEAYVAQGFSVVEE